VKSCCLYLFCVAVVSGKNEYVQEVSIIVIVLCFVYILSDHFKDLLDAGSSFSFVSHILDIRIQVTGTFGLHALSSIIVNGELDAL